MSMMVCEQRPEASRELAGLAMEIFIVCAGTIESTGIGLKMNLYESFQIKSDEE
jgi:hypothetical protein